MQAHNETEDNRDARAYPTEPMSNRWWIFLTGLWTIVLIGAAPVFLLPTTEHSTTVSNLPFPGVTSITVLLKRPLLDWTGRLRQFELQAMVHGQTRRFPWRGESWNLSQRADGVIQVSSIDGTVVIPLTD